jgi:hypothetical protein
MVKIKMFILARNIKLLKLVGRFKQKCKRHGRNISWSFKHVFNDEHMQTKYNAKMGYAECPAQRPAILTEVVRSFSQFL